MPEVDAVAQSAEQELDNLGNADIVLGILSYNNADTIGPLIHAVQNGLATYFPLNRSVIVNADGGSKDGTQERALEAALDKSTVVQVAYPVYPVHRLSPAYHGIPGKGNALRTIFVAAEKLNARACAVVDSDVQSVTPGWMEALVRPVLDKEFDFVSPYYQRHKYDGTMINGIVYPLARALYGKRIRQPIGADFAFSMKLIVHCLRQPQWDSDVTGLGIDAWITTQAICGGFKLAQAFLGPRIQSQREPAPELSAVLAQVLGSLFTEMNRTAPVWQRMRGSEAIPTFGLDSELAAEPAPVDVNRMIESFRLGYQNLQGIWKIVLPPATLLELKKLALQTVEVFRFDDGVWARIIYDFALAHRMRVMDRDHLLRALTPLYLGWVASYVLKVQDADPKDAEDRIEALCQAYEAQKSYLISRWRWPDRFNP